VYYKGGTVRGMAVVAARDLADNEELFLDYRMNLKAIQGRPGWYHPIGRDAGWRWDAHAPVGLGGMLGIREDLDDPRDRRRREEEAVAKRWIL
jgi:hypothetical protein